MTSLPAFVRGLSGRCLLLALIALPATAAAATPAGTTISNRATLAYQLADRSDTLASNEVSLRVDQLVDVAVQPADGGEVAVSSPDADRPLAFRVTNLGNGPDTLRLTRIDALGGDQFDPLPASVAIYLENGRAIGLQTSGPNADTPYVAGSNDLTLAAGQSAIVYLASNVSPGLAASTRGRSRLQAESLISGAAGALPGTALAAGSVGGVAAVVGASQARSFAESIYLVTGLAVSVSKEVTRVSDPAGGVLAMPGSTVTYRVQINVRGSGEAQGLEVVDALPAQLRYKPNSLRVAGAARTDAADADGAEISGRTLVVRLGNVQAPWQAAIEFDAYIE